MPLGSPNDGDRSLVANAADPFASPFGWHDTNGAAGPEFTITRGNNAHAYEDRNDNNVADAGSAPDGGAGLVFDFPLDLTAPPAASIPAFVTNLFYWNNIVHDVFYGYGFDEASGNFQANNYGKGGNGADYVQAEAQDGSGGNNANFQTNADNGNAGSRPRMQMFEWRSTAPNPIDVHPPSAIAGRYFGPMAGLRPEPRRRRGRAAARSCSSTTAAPLRSTPARSGRSTTAASRSPCPRGRSHSSSAAAATSP